MVQFKEWVPLGDGLFVKMFRVCLQKYYETKLYQG